MNKQDQQKIQQKVKKHVRNSLAFILGAIGSLGVLSVGLIEGWQTFRQEPILLDIEFIEDEIKPLSRGFDGNLDKYLNKYSDGDLNKFLDKYPQIQYSQIIYGLISTEKEKSYLGYNLINLLDAYLDDNFKQTLKIYDLENYLKSNLGIDSINNDLKRALELIPINNDLLKTEGLTTDETNKIILWEET